MRHKIRNINLRCFKKRITTEHFKQRWINEKKKKKAQLPAETSSKNMRQLDVLGSLHLLQQAYYILVTPQLTKFCSIWMRHHWFSSSEGKSERKSLWSTITKKGSLKTFGPSMDLQSKYWRTKQYIQSLYWDLYWDVCCV